MLARTDAVLNDAEGKGSPTAGAGEHFENRLRRTTSRGALRRTTSGSSGTWRRGLAANKLTRRHVLSVPCHVQCLRSYPQLSLARKDPEGSLRVPWSPWLREDDSVWSAQANGGRGTAGLGRSCLVSKGPDPVTIVTAGREAGLLARCVFESHGEFFFFFFF